MSRMKAYANCKLILALLIIGLSLFLSAAQAADNAIEPGGVLDRITTAYQSTLREWKPIMQSAAGSLLIALGTINIVWRAAQLLFRGSNMADLIWEVVRTITVIGFFLWLIGDPKIGGQPLYTSLLDSMGELAGKLTGGKAVTGPSSCVTAGYNAFQKILDATPDMETDGIAGTVANAVLWAMYKLTALVIGTLTMLLWIFTAVQIVIATVAFSFLLYGGLLLLGFAGTEWTRGSAMSYINALIAAALRYFGTIAAATLSYQVMEKLLETSVKKPGLDAEFAEQMVILFSFEIGVLACAFITYLLVSKLPDMLANLVSPAGNGIGVSASQGLAAAKLASAATGLTAASKALGGAAKSITAAAGRGATGLAGAAIGGAAGALTGNGIAAGARAGFSAGQGAAESFSKTRAGQLLGSVGSAVARTTGLGSKGRFASDFMKMGLDSGSAEKAAADASRLLKSGGGGNYYAVRRAIAGKNGVTGAQYDRFLGREAQEKAERRSQGSQEAAPRH